MEMTISMAIMAILFAVVVPQLRTISNSWDSKAGRSDALQNGSVLFDHLQHNLSTARRITAVSGAGESLGYIEFENNDANSFRYDINGGTNYVEFGPVGTLSDLAGPVSQFQMTCYDPNDMSNPIDPVTDPNLIRFVQVQVTIANAATMGGDLTLSTSAFLRNDSIATISEPNDPNLLFVSSGSTPTAQEAGIIALIESWGYAVTPLRAGASQGSFDSAVLVNDVAYIPEGVSQMDLGTKLRDAPIGVVFGEKQFTDEFGVAADHADYTGNQIDVLDNTHYITKTFSVALLTVAASSGDMEHPKAPLAPDATVLANQPPGENGYSALVVLEAGGAMEGGGTAAGRRVGIPIGAFQASQLTADGKTLMQRAIEWSAVDPEEILNYLLLFVVSNPASLTSEEAARKTIMESWGLTVTLIDDSAWQATFDAAVAVNDVAYVSQEAVATLLGAKLSDTTIGVVNENKDMIDDFGFATGASMGGGLPTLNVDMSHYITSVFAANPISPYVANDWYQIANEPVASGAEPVGTWAQIPWTDKPALMALSEGAQLIDGGNAAGRRVQIPWGSGQGATPVALASLSDDARTIMQRSIEWAASGAGGGPGSGTYIDLFNNQLFSGSDGTVDWSTSPWVEIGEWNGASSGDIGVFSDASAWRLRLRDNDNGGEGVEREADLSAGTSATVEFWYRRNKLDNANDYVKLEVSANGAAGPWTELLRIQGPGTDVEYQYASQDISGYIAGNTRIRFITSPNMGVQDVVWIDDVEISFSP